MAAKLHVGQNFDRGKEASKGEKSVRVSPPVGRDEEGLGHGRCPPSYRRAGELLAVRCAPRQRGRRSTVPSLLGLKGEEDRPAQPVGKQEKGKKGRWAKERIGPQACKRRKDSGVKKERRKIKGCSKIIKKI